MPCLGTRQLQRRPHTTCAQAGERAQRLASILLMLAFHLLLNGAPRFYLRYSTQLQTALRLLYYAFPLLRKPRGACLGVGGGKKQWWRQPASLHASALCMRVGHARWCMGLSLRQKQSPLPSAAGIQAVLNGEPTPGLAGALLDTLRVAWGAAPTPAASAAAAGLLLEQLGAALRYALPVHSTPESGRPLNPVKLCMFTSSSACLPRR